RSEIAGYDQLVATLNRGVDERKEPFCRKLGGSRFFEFVEHDEPSSFGALKIIGEYARSPY
ncbi:hypothetical protein ABTN27_21420, partial [Acinetobacter baumannii]